MPYSTQTLPNGKASPNRVLAMALLTMLTLVLYRQMNKRQPVQHAQPAQIRLPLPYERPTASPACHSGISMATAPMQPADLQPRLRMKFTRAPFLEQRTGGPCGSARATGFPPK